ncbi:hypothetical protein Clacol_000090 [Clathrus columnatus]|uniref:Uncharacterized protein n=1 Tax=Clathrus columnatus TaxID=1419009 RepID=A0AAV4ZYH2_9AGAM|nr:hypothetical protein Clacol_000090 [Clathrus columnatus]
MTIPETSICNDLVLSDDTISLLPLIGVQAYLIVIALTINITLVLSDVLAFLAVIRQVWGLWREKRRLGLQTNVDLVTLLLKQGILRFSFVLFMSTTGVLIEYGLGFDYAIVQNVLSSILVCEFTLDLRRRNAEESIPNQSMLVLPNISFRDNPVQSIRSVFGRLHENIISEMGERNNVVAVDGPDQELELEERHRDAA